MPKNLKESLICIFKYIFLFFVATMSLGGCISSFDVQSNRIIFNGNNFIYLIFLLGISYILNKVCKYKEKRLNIFSVFISIIISIIYVLSYSTSHYFLNGIFLNSLMFKGFILTKFLGIFILFFVLIKFTLIKLDSLNKSSREEFKYFTANKKSILIVALTIFIAYIPYIIHSFPGNLNYDFIVQIKQALNYETLTNWHPYVHTLFIKLCLKIGYFLTCNYNIGIFIYTIMQVLLSCFTFSFVIFYMAKKGIKAKLRIVTLLLFMFFPIFPLYSVWLTKDIIFSLFMVLITIGIIEISINKDIIKSKKYIIFMMFAFLLAMLSRKNGFYMLVILFPIVLLFNRKNWVRIIIMFMVPILLFKFIDGPIRETLNVPDGSKAEIYSIPAQQMARIYKYELNNLTCEQKEKIESYIMLDNIDEAYNPLISDPIKGALNIQYITSDKIEFLKFNFELLSKFPVRSIEAFLCTTYRFYYLDNDGAKGLENFKKDSSSLIKEMLPEELGIKNDFFRIKIVDYINDAIYLNEFLLLSTMTNPGLYVNILIICIGYLIYKKKFKYILGFLPVCFILLTQLAGPMVDIRYAYCIFTCFPILLSITIYNDNKKV